MNLRQKAEYIVTQLRSAGHESFFAGGCVRDALLEIEPKDYDIATAALPEQVKEIFPDSDSIGAHFGVILVKLEGEHFEVATFRNDGSYTDGRRPDNVTFSSPVEDAVRRDFTINGIFENPLTGEIVDFVHGQADLTERTIRAIGKPDARFQEDALRLLRAIRFATKLDFDIEPRTWKAMAEHAHLLKKVSVERISEEFSKILIDRNRARGLQLLVDSGLIAHFLPEILDLIDCQQPPQFHPEGDVFQHTKIMLEMLNDNQSQPTIELCLSVLLHDIGKPATYTYNAEDDRIRFNGHDTLGAKMAEKILNRLRFSNATITAVVTMVANHMNFMHVQHMRKSKLKRFMARETYQEEMELHRVDCMSSNGIKENYEFLRTQEEVFASEPLIPEALLSGKDLIEQGLTPGPVFKNVLTELQTEQLEGKIKTREEALVWLEAILKKDA